MEELKTQTLVINGKVSESYHYNNHKQEQNFNNEPTLKQQFEEIKKEIHDTRKISNVNPYFSYFPSFYKKELKNSFIVFMF
jgi:hypothetical protein